MTIKLTKPEGVCAEHIQAEGRERKLSLIVMTPEGGAKDAPGVLWIHGGGYIGGLKEMVYMSRAVDLVREYGAVVVAPSYRIAPLYPYPAAIEDCYEALLWLKENAERLNVRPDQRMAGGESAGGGLTAALCMLARDRGEVKIAYQMPLYPMLDNFDTESSAHNLGRMWNPPLHHLGWRCYLGRNAKKEVPPYASPSRQTDYRGLPPCYTFVGDGEPFYCETLSYVEKLKKAGVEASADVYHTNIHGFDMIYPEMDISKEARKRFNEHFEKAKKEYFA